MNQTWADFILEEKSKAYFQELNSFLIKEDSSGQIILPEKQNILRAFKVCPLQSVKVVILGQDPYHNIGQADGLAFSVSDKTLILPASLKNIFKELKSDLLIEKSSGDLTGWALQGILLLNSCLTVRQNTPNSHKDIGWQVLVQNVLQLLDRNKTPIVFIAWGKYAERLVTSHIQNDRHEILTAAHPSFFSAHKGFFGSRPFSKTNKFLLDHNLTLIDWSQ